MDAIVLATANAKAHDLRKILWEMGDEEFAQYAKTKWWTVLGVREEDVREEVSPHEVRFPSASIIASFLRMTSYPPSHRPLTRRRFPCGGTCSTTA